MRKSFLVRFSFIHSFLVHVSIHSMIISGYISKWGLNHIRQASFCDFVIKHSEELVSSYLSSFFHRVHEFRQRLLSLLTEFIVLPLVLEIKFIPWLASYNEISFHACRIVNSLRALRSLYAFPSLCTCLPWPSRFVNQEWLDLLMPSIM